MDVYARGGAKMPIRARPYVPETGEAVRAPAGQKQRSRPTGDAGAISAAAGPAARFQPALRRQARQSAYTSEKPNSSFQTWKLSMR